MTVAAGQVATLDVALAPSTTPQTGVSGTVTSTKGGAVAGAAVAVHGGSASARTDGSGHYQLLLPAGSYTLDISASGFTAASKAVVVGQAIASADVALDPVAAPPPLGHVSIATPFDGVEVADDTVLCTGHSVLPGLSSVTVNAAAATLDASGNFQTKVKLSPGANTLVVKASNAAGQSVTAQVHVTYTPAAPAVDPQNGSPNGGCSSGGGSGASALVLAALAMALHRRRRG